ncbi:DNA modification system-associated small protein [Aequorivita nionensis]|uniref:DNA modification system-associated small protein n=1 Tax=Aequorivita nionensis TaxID=1287690 RepID=UPI003965AD50
MKLKDEDKQLLKELCNQYNVSYEKMLKLLDTTKEYEFRERRAGIYDALSEIIKSNLKTSLP